MPALNWLHITDLHFGSPGQEWLWPNSRHLIKEDLRRLCEVAGPWDLVFFTGDLAHNGDAEQFAGATEDLSKLWELFGTLGCKPVLLAVPGNHDLQRPDKTRAIVKAIGQWHSDAQLRSEFYSDPSCEYRTLINECFDGYTSWWERQPFPKPTTFRKGLLPGDFVATVEKPGIHLAIAGLNTAFVQLTDGNYEEHLDVHERQLHSACGGDLASWSEKANLALLMTHHNPDWLHAKARDHLIAEIYAPGRFLYHFCGHLHIPKTLNISEGGAETRRLRQAPSLCGLTTWGNNEQRIHGYIAGRFEIVGVRGTELLWPRKMVKAYAGNWRMSADQGYELDRSESVSFGFIGRTLEAVDEGANKKALPQAILSTPGAEDQEDPIASVLVSGTISIEVAKAHLHAVPRFRLDVEAKHRRIRQEQQAELEMTLRRFRCGWIVSDWGLGKNGFLATVLERLSPDVSSVEAYRINCEDITTIDQLISATDDQFELPLQQFATFNAVLPLSLLVLDEFSVALSDPSCANDDGRTLNDIIDLILDYCPTMYLIIVSRQNPVGSRFSYVELEPLDLPEIRSYLSDQPALVGDDILLEQVEMRSGGLPMHLDALVKKLKVYSLAELLDAELEECRDSVEDQEPVPKALKTAVASLAYSTDRYSRRSYRMLKVLSALPNGAPFHLIRRFYPTEPFYVTNAEQLLDFSLIESTPLIPLRSEIAIKGVSGKSAEELVPKLLKVPRQIRDYMRSTMSEQEYSDIIKQSASLFFGEKWRDGRVKLPKRMVIDARAPREGLGNEHSVARHLLWQAVQDNDLRTMTLAAELSINYCSALLGADCYKEACLASEEIFHMLEKTALQKQTAQAAIIFGRALRMMGRHERAIEILESALRIGGGVLSKSDKASVYLNMALNYSNSGNKPLAIEKANLVLQLTPKDSSHYMQASAEILVNESNVQDLEAKLSLLEKKARRKGYEIVADNIALDLAERQQDVQKAVSLHDRVLVTKDIYNRVRAIVAKASRLQKEGAGSLSDSDRRALGEAYSYLFGQRLRGLFNTCHAVVWTMLRSESKLAQMLIIFRLSSFLWRIRGELKQEKKYLNEVRKIGVGGLDPGGIDLHPELNYVKLRQLEQGKEEGAKKG